jgi:hypothetical protein
LRKKTLVTIINTCIGGFLSLQSLGQLNINLPQANITGRTDYAVVLNSGVYTSVLGLIPQIDGRANDTFFRNAGNTLTVPLNALSFRLQSINNVSFFGSSQSVLLSTSYQTTYTALATVLSGTVLIQYTISVGGQTWRAGTYTTPFQLRTSSIALLSNAIVPQVQNINIIVPSFLAPVSTVAPVSIHINQFSYYRSGTASATQSISLSSTVGYQLNVQAGSPQFAYTGTGAYTPQTNVGLASALLSNQAGSVQQTLSTSNQTLTPAGGSDVPTNNNGSADVTYSITSTNLNVGFVKAGTYSVPLSYTFSSSPLQASTSSELDVVVDDMSEMSVNQAFVSINFQNSNDYKLGVTKQQPSHLKVSNTHAYNLYVKADGNFFTSGANQIPVGVVTIGPMPGQTGINSVTLSSTSQLIANSADPVVDRQISMQYSIPANQVSNLLGKPAGTYSATVTYSFVAL